MSGCMQGDLAPAWSHLIHAKEILSPILNKAIASERLLNLSQATQLSQGKAVWLEFLVCLVDPKPQAVTRLAQRISSRSGSGLPVSTPPLLSDSPWHPVGPGC